jgi:hypothetical protein
MIRDCVCGWAVDMEGGFRSRDSGGGAQEQRIKGAEGKKF